MKKIIVIIAAFLLFVSCSVQNPPTTGTLRLSVPRAVSSNTGAAFTFSTMRYSLKRDGITVPLNNQDSLEVTGSQTIEITDLIPGSGYRLSLSLGNKTGSILDVAYYGKSEEFSITEGTASEVQMTLVAAPIFTYLTKTGARSSATVVGTTKYILDGSELRGFIDPLSVTPKSLTGTGTGVVINSLSTGKKFSTATVIEDELWLNTDKGIYNGIPGAFSHLLNSGIEPNVVFSRAVEVSFSGSTKIVGFYSGGGTVLGMAVAANQAGLLAAWETIEKYPEIKEYIPEITRDMINNIGINEDNASNFYYVCTPLGTVIGSAEIAGVETLFSLDNPSLWLKIDDGAKPVTVVSSAGNRVYAASDLGLFTAVVIPTTGIPAIPLALIAGTGDEKIVSLSSFKYSSNVVTAAVTEQNSVIIVKDGAVLKTLEAETGIPENASAVFYTGTSNILHLILTGTNGAIDYAINLNTTGV